MKLIKEILDFFKPNDFETNNYAWLTNQLAHIKGSYVLSVFVFSISLFSAYVMCFFKYNLVADVFRVSVGVSLFWVLWELRHLYISKNIKDFLEDLFFELSGVFLFYLIFNYVPRNHYLKLIIFNFLIIIVTTILYYKRTQKT